MKREITPTIYTNLFPGNNILSEEELLQINNNSKAALFKNKDMIFKQNTPTSHVMLIKSGLVKLFKEGRNNKSVILNIVTPGKFLGLNSIFSNGIFQYSASAIENTEVLYIDITIFNSIVENNGRYTKHILKLLSIDNLSIFEKLISQSQKQLPGRIADIILYFSDIIYQSSTFEFPLTRTELAEMAGTTKESIIRTLTEFKNDKIIELDGKFVSIKSKEIVKTLSKIG